MNLKTVAMAVSWERLITTIPTREEEEAEADGNEVDGESTTDEFDDDLDKDPTYEPGSMLLIF